jgi:glycosidase
MEFHVSRQARDKYQFDAHLFSSTGNVVFADFHAARLFAQKMNDKRDLVNHPGQAVKTGQINAMGLIDEILHIVIAHYRKQIKPQVFREALEWLHDKHGDEPVEKTLLKFLDEFPPLEIYTGKITPQLYLQGSSAGVSNRELVLEEMLLLWLANLNPAFSPFIELFDDETLEKETVYGSMMESLHEFFESQPKIGAGFNLVAFLRLPAMQNPFSLEEQLQFMRLHWGILIEELLYRLLISFDLIKEETKPIFFGPPLTEAPSFWQKEYEPERFSPDLHWMPRLVLIAKSTLVWLDQLSKKYDRAITRLDQIPDEEIDILARWGFTGLWLIGVWQRSPASKQLKQLCGNPEAESSAYSLFDYEIAYELGGWEALQSLKHRCGQRGIRLGCDMVPNHTGIDSRWVREHPDWYVSLPYPPFPAYSFNGPNLSSDPRYGIYIDDKYYSQQDAAVVFKRHDFWTGDVRYIYHGNDGTRMPWNDTAQLNYLNPEVREAAIRTILHVAHNFSVIRFDAAMTLAKRHYQRLWFPEPGTGGDIPSRAGHGLTKDEFNRAIPNEFWREVVDRVAAEAPDTLLLAEAFWLMEGYFVRTLGMHRVYNSAFMNMLKNEENQKYRETIKNTIQFNPEILKRYVNFMNNPDEDTAVAQFGKDDKYFGVCTMLVTMPGLPMIGHGQVEGLTEKYGMEYRRAYWEEQVDGWLVDRHEREIFPLMKKRYLFAEVDNFLLYDFFSPDGSVNENVFAYSNRFGEERGLVIYHNKFADARGWIRHSTAFAVKTGMGEETQLIQRDLGQGLGIYHNENYFCIFRDHISGLEYIRNCKDLCEQGLYVELGAFKYQVYLDFRQLHDNEWRHYAQLAGHLNGRGVPSIDEALRELYLLPLHKAYDALINVETVKRFSETRRGSKSKKVVKEFLDDFENRYSEFLTEAKRFSSGDGKESVLSKTVRSKLESLIQIDSVSRRFPMAKSKTFQTAMKFLKSQFAEDGIVAAISFGWLCTHAVGKILKDKDFELHSRSWIDEWLLGKRLQNVLSEMKLDDTQRWEGRQLVALLAAEQNWHEIDEGENREHLLLERLLKSPDVQQFLKVNRYDGVLWFNKENFEKLTRWLFVIAVVQITSQPKLAKAKAAKAIADVFAIVEKWRQAEKGSEYRVEKLLAATNSAVAKKTRAVKSKKVAKPKSINNKPKAKSKKTTRVKS